MSYIVCLIPFLHKLQHVIFNLYLIVQITVKPL